MRIEGGSSDREREKEAIKKQMKRKDREEATQQQ